MSNSVKRLAFSPGRPFFYKAVALSWIALILPFFLCKYTNARIYALMNIEYAKKNNLLILKILESLYFQSPFDGQIAQAYARILIVNNRPFEAIEVLNRAERLTPDYIVNLHLANAYAITGQLEKAISEYEKILSFAPRTPLAYKGLLNLAHQELLGLGDLRNPRLLAPILRIAIILSERWPNDPVIKELALATAFVNEDTEEITRILESEDSPYSGLQRWRTLRDIASPKFPGSPVALIETISRLIRSEEITFDRVLTPIFFQQFYFVLKKLELENPSFNSDVTFFQAYIIYLSHNEAEAARILQNALRLNPQNADAKLLLSKLQTEEEPSHD